MLCRKKGKRWRKYEFQCPQRAVQSQCNVTDKLYSAVLQLKRTGSKVLLQGKALDDAIAVAITAMNEPKTCSITTLRRYLVDSNKGRTENYICERPCADLHHCAISGSSQNLCIWSPVCLFQEKHS